MRHRSLTNSRPAKNLEFRETYMQHEFEDELLPYFPLFGHRTVKVPGYDAEFMMHNGLYPLEPHHAFGGRKGRWDRDWNLVAVCRPVHEWCERYKFDGRVLVLRLKLDKAEWDEADAHACLGMYPLGDIFKQQCEFPFAESIRVELCRQVEAGAIP